jgi:hypothetical protein
MPQRQALTRLLKELRTLDGMAVQPSQRRRQTKAFTPTFQFRLRQKAVVRRLAKVYRESLAYKVKKAYVRQLRQIRSHIGTLWIRTLLA